MFDSFYLAFKLSSTAEKEIKRLFHLGKDALSQGFHHTLNRNELKKDQDWLGRNAVN